MTVEQINALLTLTSILARLVNDGLITVRRLREIAATAGATQAELADLDRRLSDAIASRESEG